MRWVVGLLFVLLMLALVLSASSTGLLGELIKQIIGKQPFIMQFQSLIMQFQFVDMLSAIAGGLINTLLFVPIVGLIVGLRFGLSAFFAHFALRFWLWCTGSLPWSLVAFLDEATERLLLLKVGGGYIFIHHLLLNYFTNLEKRDP